MSSDCESSWGSTKYYKMGSAAVSGQSCEGTDSAFSAFSTPSLKMFVQNRNDSTSKGSATIRKNSRPSIFTKSKDSPKG